ncbi:MAG: DsbA family protein [Pseudomonadota bacterium]
MAATRDPALLTVFHRADDPWSFLLCQALPRLVEIYDVRLRFVTVPVAGPDFSPRPAMTLAHAMRDAADLAGRLELSFPERATAPDPEDAARMQRLLLARRDAASYLDAALAAGEALFGGPRAKADRLAKEVALPAPEEAEAALQRNLEAQIAAGHYLSAMIRFEDDWYWGVDRLPQLETVLINRGFRRGAGVPGAVRRRPAPRLPDAGLAGDDAPTLRFYCSFRSPYSYLAAERTFALGRRWRVRVEPRLIIPMKMAGFAVPKIKADYFRMDCAREGLRLGVPFGHFTDPFGDGLLRAMSLVPMAREADLLEPFILAAMRGVWAEGRDLADDADLAAVAAAAGLDPASAAAAADPGADLSWADAHRQELAALGQYAAPTFALGRYATWGQDRLWMLEQVLDAQAVRR